MSALEIFGRLTRNPSLMERMFATLGVRDWFRANPNGPAVLRRAALRCTTCSQAAACAQWLDAAAEPTEAPGYCRNHDLIERIRRAGA